MTFPDSTSSIVISNSSFVTSAGTTVGIKTDNTEPRKDGEGVNPKLYFKFVKSKLEKIEKAKLRKKLLKLQELVNTAKETGQQAFYEKLMETIAVIVREMECEAVGCDRWVSQKVIDRFHKVYRPEGKKIVFFEPWEKFPRTPPKNVQEHIKKIRDLKLFDEYHVLYLDYAKQELKTNKEKIKEKDPILFGRFSYAPDRYYFIIDWVDEYCDLTFDKFIDEVRTEKIDNKTPEALTQAYFDQVKKEVMDRHNRLKSTNFVNYRDNMAEEYRLKKAKKKPWWKFWGK